MSRRAALVALFALFILAWLTPLRRELFVGDETKYSEVVREMRATGNWFLPPLEGTPFTHKPPLHFWILGTASLLFGTHSIWTFVLPSLAAFAWLLWLMWRMGGPLAAFVCGSSLLVWGSAQSARMDVSFTACITLAAWMLARFFDGERRALVVAGLALGIGTMLKGPMAPVIAILLFALECWRRRSVPRGNYAAAIALMALIPLAWFLPAMQLGGGNYTHEVLSKQLAGRAVGAWVHQSPPWMYLLHSPGFLFPWFAALVAALAVRWREERFAISWIIAVLVPYSLMSSKLDVYMMALVPPVALVIARALTAADVRGIRIANVITLALLLAVAVTGLVLPASKIKGADSVLIELPAVRMLFVILGVAAAAALVISLRGALASTIALGFVPLAAFAWIAVVLMPVVNELASTRPLIAALAAQNVAPESISLYSCPHLWSRDMPPELDRVRYVSPSTLADATVIATSRSRAADIAPQLAGWHRVSEVRMIGKWFDVYRR